MDIDRSVYDYADFVPREFVLYCHEFSSEEENGATTFIDGSALALALPGKKAEKFKTLNLAYRNKVHVHCPSPRSNVISSS